MTGVQRNREFQQLCKERLQKGLKCYDCIFNDKYVCRCGADRMTASEYKKVYKAMAEQSEMPEDLRTTQDKKYENSKIAMLENIQTGETKIFPSGKDLTQWLTGSRKRDWNIDYALRSNGKHLYKDKYRLKYLESE